MQATHILTIGRNEEYFVVIVEQCEKRGIWDNETLRVQILGAGILRVRPDQLKAI